MQIPRTIVIHDLSHDWSIPVYLFINQVRGKLVVRRTQIFINVHKYILTYIVRRILYFHAMFTLISLDLDHL